MTPITTTLTGAHGIRAGLNRDSLTLDLTAIPDDALSVALKGDNGMGKSTILNLALTPWREPPQIAGTIYDQFGETGLRELIWSHGGETYRTRIEYRNTGKTKTQRAYLHVHGDGMPLARQEWTPVTLPDHTTSDGKASTYDACLSHILGDQGIYFLSAFRAQNAPKLAEHDDPKGLMRALLNLDEPARLSDLARDVARGLKRHHEGLRAQVANLDGHPARLTALDQAIKDIRYSHQARAEANIAAIDGVSRAKAELDRAMAGDLDRQRLIDARAAVQRRLDEATGSTADAIQQAQRAYTAAKQRVTDAQRHASATLATLQRDLTAAQARVTAAQATLSQRDAIAKAQADADALAAQIAAQEQTAAALADQLSALRDLAGQVRTLAAQQAAAAQAGKAGAGKVNDLNSRIADLAARAGFVAVVPCKGEGQYAACPALQDAIAARELADGAVTRLLSEATEEIEAKRAEWKAIAAQIADLSAKTVNLPQCAEAHSAAVTLIGTLRDRLDAVRAVAARGAALELAEQHLAEATAAAADIDARMGAHRDASSRQIDVLENELTAAIDAVTAAEMLAANTIAALRAELAALPEPGTDQAITQARAALAAALAESEEAKAAMQQAAANIAQHQAEQAALRAALEQGAAVIAQRDHLAAEIADWTLLAMGLRGVIDLSIEDAGPSIAATANRLLADAYGPRFSLRIVTQRDQANGKTVEAFDLSVIDADSGMESSIMQKSGGEAVWLDKALTDAVGLYHQETAGVHYDTLFADESEDGLTQERKAQFYRMDRAALAAGGYQRKYFVSHNPDAWAYADHVIDLAQYGVMKS